MFFNVQPFWNGMSETPEIFGVTPFFNIFTLLLAPLRLYITFEHIPMYSAMVACRILTGFILLVLLAPLHAEAQIWRYKIGYFGFLDNREYFNPYVNDQTIFGSRLYGEAGVSFDENKMIMGGINYLYEFGSKGELLAPDITLYYNSKHKNLDFYLGAFPRLNLIQMPMALMIDTFQYYRPNVEGILMNYSTKNFRHNIWIDWTGRQSNNTRERFMLGFSGWARMGILTYQHHFVMSHVAHTFNSTPDQHLRDNGGFSAMLGMDLSSLTGLDSLTFSAGFLGSYDRLRGVYDMVTSFGCLGEIEAVYKGFGLHGIIYSGDSQEIISGDGFYRSAFYSRADAFYQVSRSGIQGRLQFSFHFVPDILDLSMSLLIRAQLEGIFRSHHSN